jgi:hypothetical protein
MLLAALCTVSIGKAQVMMPAGADGVATLTINSDQPGADIQVDGMFVGNAPTTIQLGPGVHTVVLQQGTNSWRRELRITGGVVTINARLSRTATQRMSRPRQNLRLGGSVDQQTGGA